MTKIHKHRTPRANAVFRRLFKITGLTNFLGGLLILVAPASSVQAASVTLAWNRSPDPKAIGYNIYYWDANVAPSNVIFFARELSVGNVTNATVTNLVAGTTNTF